MSLEGSPHDMSLGDLLRVFRLGSKSGVLQLLHGDQHGVLYVSDGRLIDATATRGPERTVTATADRAVIAMLGWKDATFRFRHDATVCAHPVRIEHDGEWLMEEVLKRGMPHSPRTERIVTLDMPLRLGLMPGNAQNGVILNAERWQILSQIAGGNTLRQACAAAGIEAETALDVARELLALGLLEYPAVPTMAQVHLVPEYDAVPATSGAHAPAPSHYQRLTELTSLPRPPDVREPLAVDLNGFQQISTMEATRGADDGRWPVAAPHPVAPATPAVHAPPAAPYVEPAGLSPRQPGAVNPARPPAVSRGILGSIIRKIRGL